MANVYGYLESWCPSRFPFLSKVITSTNAGAVIGYNRRGINIYKSIYGRNLLDEKTAEYTRPRKSTSIGHSLTKKVLRGSYLGRIILKLTKYLRSLPLRKPNPRPQTRRYSFIPLRGGEGSIFRPR
ncbi:uncharacterized protein N7498_004696 [Penicillium cinerascens]|uniref:Uncharacterized protein n=1 Tax=Penicillium cinerascens TaxID=70096 RepID=A0A9W9MM55_9EURO|nr:uncharacterized protein N7498_004696 [Penicillium cinerascens]KAJ5203817.1 hypothetical protein N7498_004696 [Penicillium cinerascens]